MQRHIPITLDDFAELLGDYPYRVDVGTWTVDERWRPYPVPVGTERVTEIVCHESDFVIARAWTDGNGNNGYSAALFALEAHDIAKCNK